LATATRPGTGLATDISSESESLDRDEDDIIFLQNQPRGSEKEINETRNRRVIHSFMSLNHKKGMMGFNGAAGCPLGQLLLRHRKIVRQGYTKYTRYIRATRDTSVWCHGWHALHDFPGCHDTVTPKTTKNHHFP
jgi:hypothetical protein